MKLTLDLGNLEEYAVRQGRFSQFRYRRLVINKAAKVNGGHARIQLVAAVYIRPRKTKFKAG